MKRRRRKTAPTRYAPPQATVHETPTRREVLALALLADVDPETALRALVEGSGAIAGDDGHRLAIALHAMQPPRRGAA